MANTNQPIVGRANYYSPERHTVLPPKKQPKKRRHTKLVVTLILLVVIGLGAYAHYHHHNLLTKATNAISSVIKKPSSNNNSAYDAAIATMGQTINSVISNNANIQISVNLINLDNNQSLHYGVNQTFQAASTAKILTAEYYLHEVEEGDESLNETINGNTAEYEIQQMIVISDDNAWAALNDDLGYTNLQNYADSTFGINDYEAYNNSLSSGDIAVALQQLWENKILNSSDTQLLLSYMKQANYRQYIVPAVPSEDTIYHKIGLYEDYVNDAAIITHGNDAFVIVIFTNGNGVYNWPARATMMQQITKAALKAYFNQA